MNRLTKHWLTKRLAAAAVTGLIVFAAVAAALLLRPDALRRGTRVLRWAGPPSHWSEP